MKRRVAFGCLDEFSAAITSLKQQAFSEASSSTAHAVRDVFTSNLTALSFGPNNRGGRKRLPKLTLISKFAGSALVRCKPYSHRRCKRLYREGHMTPNSILNRAV